MGKFEKGRKMVEQMRELGEAKAPDTLLPNVLAELNLGDGYWTTATPLGTVYVAFNSTGIAAVMLEKSAEEFEQKFKAEYGRAAYRLEQPPMSLKNAVLKRLDGEIVPDLHFDLRHLTEFERAVLQKTLEIPAGQVRTYGWVAREIGRDKAVRAVGSALGRNPIPLLIPCHRVVKSDGTLGHYSLGGAENKVIMLRSEGIALEEPENLAKSRVRWAK
jgi:O-6-methylguanine DNA methyltransferase